MKKVALFFIGMICFACQNSEDVYEEVAKKLCDCQRPMVKALEDVLAIKASGRNPIESELETLDLAMDEAASCMERSMSELKDFDYEDEEKIDAAMTRICPELEKKMNQLEDLY